MNRQPDESSVEVLPRVVLICWLLALCSHPAIGRLFGSGAPDSPGNSTVVEETGAC